MKKLIYLEDAIDAICKKCKADYPDTTACDICDDISILKSLPSAEPEKVCIANITLSEEQLREAVDKAKEELKNSPILIEPERKTGRWITDSDVAFHWKCSECGSYLFWDKEKYLLREEDELNYCPNCGCAMKGESCDGDSCPIRYKEDEQ